MTDQETSIPLAEIQKEVENRQKNLQDSAVMEGEYRNFALRSLVETRRDLRRAGAVLWLQERIFQNTGIFLADTSQFRVNSNQKSTIDRPANDYWATVEINGVTLKTSVGELVAEIPPIALNCNPELSKPIHSLADLAYIVFQVRRYQGSLPIPKDYHDDSDPFADY